MTDAVLLARARGSRNKRHSRRHALRLTLLVHFADESCPRIIRTLDEVRPKSVRCLSDFLSGVGQPAELITAARRFVQRLLCATRRDASGTPVLFLPQPVALAACRPVRRLLFLPLLDHGLSLLRLEVAHAFVRAVDHGQFTAGDVIEQPTPGRCAAILAAAIGGEAQQNLPVNLIQFQ